MSVLRTVGLALALCLVCLFPLQAAAKNVALIVGNGDYRNVARLPNPTNDAALAVSTFSALGFQTSVILNADAAEMRRALEEFHDSSSNADIAAIVFAGHGIQTDNINYLVAIDTNAESKTSFQETAVRMDEFVNAFSKTSSVRLLIVDACRDNPFAQTRSLTSFLDKTSRGLARVNQQASDLIVLYSAQPNQRALDGDGINSPFMEAVSSVLLSQPSIKLSEALIDITNRVNTSTGKQQTPYTEGSLSVHVELKLAINVTVEKTPAAFCDGATEEVPFRKENDDFLALSEKTRKLIVSDGGHLRIEVCSDGNEVFLQGPSSARYTGDALRNSADEGVGYYFNTSDQKPAYLWLFVNKDKSGAPVEIGYYLNEEEIKWVETPWVLP